MIGPAVPRSWGTMGECAMALPSRSGSLPADRGQRTFVRLIDRQSVWSFERCVQILATRRS